MVMSSLRRSALVALIGTLAMLAPSASGQTILKRTKSKDLTLTFSVHVQAWQERRTQPGNIPGFDEWNFEQTAIVFPINPTFATADLKERGVTSKLTFNKFEVPDAFQGFMVDYHSGARLGKWGMEAMKKGRQIRFTVSLPYTCYETEFNEEASVRAVWPKEWPAEAASTFERQMFVDFAPGDRQYNMRKVDELVKKWTDPDVKNAHPVVAAKLLAGKVAQHVRQLNGTGLAHNRDGQLEGIELRGVPVIAGSGRGNEFELTCFLASVYRRAGIPARIVIGFDVNEDEDKKFLGKGKKINELRSWVEFALSDPQQDRVVWIPVDIRSLWEDRNGGIFNADDYYMYPLKHFGTLEDFDRVIPFAFNFHPPTTVRSYGSPGFWGWLMLPESPEGAKQTIQFNATSTSRRGGQPAQEPDYPDEG